jgi:hypothetical protein
MSKIRIPSFLALAAADLLAFAPTAQSQVTVTDLGSAHADVASSTSLTLTPSWRARRRGAASS